MSQETQIQKVVTGAWLTYSLKGISIPKAIMPKYLPPLLTPENNKAIMV